jgi:hypothetical protein
VKTLINLTLVTNKGIIKSVKFKDSFTSTTMATDKKSFLIYCDIIHTVEQLTDEQAGDLFKHLLRYVNDLNPQSDSVITKIAFEPIRQALKRDLDKYETIRKRNSDNARMRWDATASSGIPNDTKNADSDIVIGIDSDKDIKKQRVVFEKPTLSELKTYMTEIGMADVSEKWFDYYESNGWLVGKNKMKNWRAAVRTWKNNNLSNNVTTPQVINRKVFNLREYDERT